MPRLSNKEKERCHKEILEMEQAKIKLYLDKIEELEKKNAKLIAENEKLRSCEKCGNYNWQGCVFSASRRLECWDNKFKYFVLEEVK